MKKFLIGLFCGLILAALLAFLFIFAIVRMTQNRPTIADGSTLILKLEGDVPEKPPVTIPLAMFEDKAPLTIRDTWSVLHRAASDSRIRAVILVPRNLTVGWARLEELRQSLLSFKKSGKPVYALLRFPGTREYYVATAADRIYAAPDDYVDLKGLRLDAMYFRNGMDKIGAELEVEHAGKYKDAFDPFTRTSMTPETRQQLNDILDQFYGNLTQVIAEGRKKTSGEVAKIIDNGPFTGPQALASGLVDSLGYEDQVLGDLKQRLNQKSITKLSFRDYIRGLDPDTSRARVAFIVGEGDITQGSDDEGLGGDSGIKSGSFIKLLRDAGNDTSIKGVIVRIDSPGGDAIASEDILHAIKDLDQKKPAIVSMSDYAASGGYFMAVSGDPIVAYPNTLTGSIGVISAILNLHGLYDKLGINKELLSRGKFAELDSDYKPLTDEERAKFREMVMSTYQGFVSTVATGRHRKYDEIEPLAQGRVWMGAQAKQNGLVDQLGGLDTAAEMIRNRAKLAPSDRIVLVPYPPKRSLFDVLTNPHEDTDLVEATANRVLARLPNTAWMRAAFHGGVLMLMPYAVDVK